MTPLKAILRLTKVNIQRLIRYYLFLERPLLIITFIAFMVAMGIIFALIVTGIQGLITSTVHYYQTVDQDQANCLRLAESSRHVVIWKDETISGFGPEGSYGCYLLDLKKEDINDDPH